MKREMIPGVGLEFNLAAIYNAWKRLWSYSKLRSVLLLFTALEVGPGFT